MSSSSWVQHPYYQDWQRYVRPQKASEVSHLAFLRCLVLWSTVILIWALVFLAGDSHRHWERLTLFCHVYKLLSEELDDSEECVQGACLILLEPEHMNEIAWDCTYTPQQLWDVRGWGNSRHHLTMWSVVFNVFSVNAVGWVDTGGGPNLHSAAHSSTQAPRWLANEASIYLEAKQIQQA